MRRFSRTIKTPAPDLLIISALLSLFTFKRKPVGKLAHGNGWTWQPCRIDGLEKFYRSLSPLGRRTYRAVLRRREWFARLETVCYAGQGREAQPDEWPHLVDGLRSANEELIALLAAAPESQPAPVAPRVRTVLVVNRSQPGGGIAPQIFITDLDWREYALLQRLHLLDHRAQIKNLRAALQAR
jgi:hypothetical protein